MAGNMVACPLDNVGVYLKPDNSSLSSAYFAPTVAVRNELNEYTSNKQRQHDVVLHRSCAHPSCLNDTRDIVKMEYVRKIAQDACLLAGMKTPDWSRVSSSYARRSQHVPCTVTTNSTGSNLKTYPYSLSSACGNLTATHHNARPRVGCTRHRFLSGPQTNRDAVQIVFSRLPNQLSYPPADIMPHHPPAGTCVMRSPVAPNSATHQAIYPQAAIRQHPITFGHLQSPSVPLSDALLRAQLLPSGLATAVAAAAAMQFNTIHPQRMQSHPQRSAPHPTVVLPQQWSSHYPPQHSPQSDVAMHGVSAYDRLISGIHIR